MELHLSNVQIVLEPSDAAINPIWAGSIFEGKVVFNNFNNYDNIHIFNPRINLSETFTNL